MMRIEKEKWAGLHKAVAYLRPSSRAIVGADKDSDKWPLPAIQHGPRQVEPAMLMGPGAFIFALILGIVYLMSPEASHSTQLSCWQDTPMLCSTMKDRCVSFASSLGSYDYVQRQFPYASGIELAAKAYEMSGKILSPEANRLMASRYYNWKRRNNTDEDFDLEMETVEKVNQDCMAGILDFLDNDGPNVKKR